MQTIPLVLLAVLASPHFVRAQDAQSTAHREPAAPVFSADSAHVLGNLHDGTPPPPAPPKPVFVVPPQDILATATHQQGGRTITIQKIKPIALPPPPPLEPNTVPSEAEIAALKARVALYRTKNPSKEFISAGATVYRSTTSPARSLVRIWPNGEGEPVDFWSSADFGYLSGFPSFVGSDGKTRCLFMMWSSMDTTRMAAMMATKGRDYHPPLIPAFPDGPASYAFIGQIPSDRVIASVQSLHDLYNNEFSRLKAAYEGRQRASLLRAAELKANPPQPKDIVINYWRTDTPSQVPATRGGAR